MIFKQDDLIGCPFEQYDLIGCPFEPDDLIDCPFELDDLRSEWPQSRDSTSWSQEVVLKMKWF